MTQRLLAAAVASVVAMALGSSPLRAQPEEVIQGEIEIDGIPDFRGAGRAQQEFRKEVDAFKAKAGEMAPDDLASQWLRLFDRAAAISDAPSHSPSDIMSDVLAVLPPPTSWPALAAQVEARPMPAGGLAIRSRTLRYLAYTLTGANERAAAVMGELQKIVKDADVDPRSRYEAGLLMQKLAGTSINDPEQALAAFEMELAATDVDRGFGQEVAVPDLVAIAGATRAEAALRKAMVGKKPLDFDEAGEATVGLARKIAVELLPQMRFQPWGLVSIDTPELYEALEKQVKPRRGVVGRLLNRGQPEEADGNEYERDQARETYLGSLLLAGRADDGVRVTRSLRNRDNLGYGLQHEIENSAKSDVARETLQEILTKHPDLPLWELYKPLALRAGKTADMLRLARAAAGRDGLAPDKRLAARSVLADALLADDQVDEAAEAVRGLARDETLRQHDRTTRAFQLATLGKLLERPEWVAEGIELARAAVAAPPKPRDPDEPARLFERREMTGNLAKHLADAGRRDEAIKLLQEKIDQPAPAGDRFAFMDRGQQELLVQVARIYHGAGEHAKVLELLDTSKSWGASDLSEVGIHSYGDDVPLSVIAAAALAGAGRADEARKIVESVLLTKPRMDAGYELLVRIDGERALPLLEKMYQADQFEERPLIWKAIILLSAGKLDEAEATARKAISIDPSDGEQGPGDRMKVYAVLADVLAKKGNAKEADFFREVVKAIRISEDADALYRAGLHKRGIALYRQALTHFQDAYCIQSRLAVQLAEAGQHEQAAEHYRKAYELMPSSFGRVESHCFGCEGAFRGATAQGIAEGVFTKLLKEQPDKPQLHYLLGYLREQQERPADALPAYRQAVKLDPDYLNAWTHLNNVGEKVPIPENERAAISLQILRLDPLSRHSTPNFKAARDLAALWAAVETALKQRPVAPTRLYPLKASAAAIAAKPPEDDERMRHFTRYSLSDRKLTSPGDALARTELMQAIAKLLEEGD